MEADVILTEKLRRYFRLALTKSDLPSYLRDEVRKYASGRRSPEATRKRTVPYNVVKSVQSVVSAQGKF